MKIPVRPRFFALDIIGGVFGFLVTVPMGIVFVAESFSSWVPEPGGLVIYLLVAMLLFFAGAIARWMPTLALLVAWAGAAVQMAAGIGPNIIDLPILAVLFATAAWGSRRLLTFGGLSTVAGAVVAGLYTPVSLGVVNDDGMGPARYLVTAVLVTSFVLLTLVLAWGSGLLWRMVLNGRRTRMAQVRAEALAASEAERVRIARDMHDVVAHSLAVVIAQADGARYAAKTAPDLAAEALTTIASTARGALTDVRVLLTQLRHQQSAGPQPTLDDLEGLFVQLRQAGMDLRVTVAPVPPGDPPASIQLAVYRIVQEALTNAMRHGDGDSAQPVDVTLSWWADAVDVVILNAVSARRPSRSEATVGGHGLIGMTERAHLVGGMLSAERFDEQFVVRARLPIGSP